MSFSELCAASYFSFLQASTSPEDLVDVASALEVPALGLMDRNCLHGVIPFFQRAKEKGIHPVIGAEVDLENGGCIGLLCKSQEGYRNLSALISAAQWRKEKGEALATLEELSKYSPGLFCIVNGDKLNEQRKLQLQDYLDCFSKENTFISLSKHLDPGDDSRCQQLRRLAKEHGIQCIASNRPRYGRKGEGRIHDVLLCIRKHCKLKELHHHRPGNHQHFLKGFAEMKALFTEGEEELYRTVELAEACQVDLDLSSYALPDFPTEQGQSPHQALETLCLESLPRRYPQKEEMVQKRLQDELDLVKKLNLSNYFLIVWDIVRHAQEQGVPVQGRGSAANSLIAYVLGITPVDPIAHKLFLGRFIHEGMRTIPDIDLDFASTRDPRELDREDIIRYVQNRYGRDHVAMACTFITFRLKSAIREVGKVLDLPEELLGEMAKLGRLGDLDLIQHELRGLPQFQNAFQGGKWEHFSRLVQEIRDIPRHVSIHVGGMVVTGCPITDLMPTEPARMEGRFICQWDKDMLEDAGLIKIDILGLGMLAVLREATSLVEESEGLHLEWDDLPVEDEGAYALMEQGDTVGLFQVESRAQMQSLTQTCPKNLSELAIQIALIRPGPLQGKMVSPYILRKQGKEPVSYPHPCLEGILEDTLGVILFQEQVLQVAVAIAGFSPSQAEGLRRAMSRKRSTKAIEALLESFLQGAKEKEVPEEEAMRVFHTLEGFASYGFCKSHAMAFAHISYASAYLKAHHLAAFTAALLNNQPMGFYSSNTLIQDARRHGLKVLPVDVSHSRRRSHVEDGKLRLGLNLVKGLHDESVEKILSLQRRGALEELLNDLQLPREQMERLIHAGALDSLGKERRDHLWGLWSRERWSEVPGMGHHAPELPEQSRWERWLEENLSMGLSASRHPLEMLRPQLRKAGVLLSVALPGIPEGASVRIAGKVIIRQRPPTAKGFTFLTLEDERGLMNVVIKPRIFEQNKLAIFRSYILIVDGVIETRGRILNVQAKSLYGLSVGQLA